MSLEDAGGAAGSARFEHPAAGVARQRPPERRLRVLDLDEVVDGLAPEREDSLQNLAHHVGRDDEVVIHCLGETCSWSAYASAKAVLWGFKRVYYFNGGLPAWKANTAGTD